MTAIRCCSDTEVKWDAWLIKPQCFWLCFFSTYIIFKVIIPFVWDKFLKIQQSLISSYWQEVKMWYFSFILILQLSSCTDNANCYQRENVQFKARKKKKKKTFQRMTCKTWYFTFEYYFNCFTHGSHFSGSGNIMFGVFLWYKYRYMVILLATTTRLLSMQMECG